MNIITASNRIDNIGYETENGRTQVHFDLSDLMEEFPGGFGTLLLRRPNECNTTIPQNVSIEENELIWTVSDYEVENRGILQAQIIYTAGETVAKTRIYKFRISEALPDGAEPVPEGWVEWVNSLLTAASSMQIEIAEAQETLEDVSEIAEDIRETLPGQIQDAVDGAVEQVLNSEQDPTVPEWAKQATKPVYTAQEVGALPEDTFIPSKTSELTNDSNFYVKPQNGIPAEDLEPGIIPDMSDFLKSELKGAPNGVAELDEAGKVPTAQLPEWTDDVLEYPSTQLLPRQGVSGVIYMVTSINKLYRYDAISGAYRELSGVELGETATTAYRGDRGKYAYDKAMMIYTATRTDINKALSPKTVVDGEVTEWQFLDIGESDYDELANKPQINGVELEGDKSFEDLGFPEIATRSETKEIISEYLKRPMLVEATGEMNLVTGYPEYTITENVDNIITAFKAGRHVTVHLPEVYDEQTDWTYAGKYISMIEYCEPSDSEETTEQVVFTGNDNGDYQTTIGENRTLKIVFRSYDEGD